MTRKIVSIRDYLSVGYTSPPVARNGKTGVRFPLVRRGVTTTVDGLTPVTYYTLSSEPDSSLAPHELQPVHAPSRALDTGLIIVRQHWSMDIATGYMEATLDLQPESLGQMVFQAPTGIFSIVRRPHPNGPAIVYTMRIDHPREDFDYWGVAVDADGQEWAADDWLFGDDT